MCIIGLFKITNEIYIVTMFATVAKIVLIICRQTFIIVIIKEQEDHDILKFTNCLNNHENSSSNV